MLPTASCAAFTVLGCCVGLEPATRLSCAIVMYRFTYCRQLTDESEHAADGTFGEGEDRRRPALAVVPIVGFVVAVTCMVAAIGFSAETRPVRSALMQKNGQRTMMLEGFNYAMQEEADKALRLCEVGLMGENQHCAKHVVNNKLTKWTHTDQGQNEWEETQRFMPSQVGPITLLLSAVLVHLAGSIPCSLPFFLDSAFRDRTICASSRALLVFLARSEPRVTSATAGRRVGGRDTPSRPAEDSGCAQRVSEPSGSGIWAHS